MSQRQKLLKLFEELEKQDCPEINKTIFDKIMYKLYGYCPKTREEYFNDAILSGFLKQKGNNILEIDYEEIKKHRENIKVL